MAHKVHLQGVQFYGFHGVFEHEHHVGTRFEVDCTVTLLDSATGFETGKLEDTVDYGAIARLIVSIGTREIQVLIERLAMLMATQIKALRHVDTVQLHLKKQVSDVMGAPRWVGVEVQI